MRDAGGSKAAGVALSPRQRDDVRHLVEGKRITPVVADQVRAQAFLDAADERLEQCKLLTSPVVKYGVAYDAAHNTGEALLSSFGYRTTNRPGQHEAIGKFLEAVFDKPPGRDAARQFDRLRRSRNQSNYEAIPVGQAEADLAVRTARQLVDAARDLIGD